MSTPENPAPGPTRSAAPAPLVVAASVAAVEALVLLVQGVAELTAISGERLVMGATTAVFFVLYAGGLGFCAWALTRLQSWARAPIVVAQLIQLAVAASFWGGATTVIAVVLVVAALVVLAGIFHPASMRALDAAA